MTTPHADGPEAEKAAWAGGDAEDVAAAQAADQQAEEAMEGEIVEDGPAPAAETGAAGQGDPAAGGDAGAGGDASAGGAADADGDAAAGATSELQVQLDERTADLQRVSAEFANYRRRVERDRQAMIDTAKGSVLAELLPIVDDLDRAREHGDLEEGPLKVFSDKVRALLASQGVEAFGEEGEAFDPAIHEAVQDESEGSEPVLGTILRKGYRHGERTLRTAMVTVR